MNKRKIMFMMAGMVLPILAPQASAAAEHHDWEDHFHQPGTGTGCIHALSGKEGR